MQLRGIGRWTPLRLLVKAYWFRSNNCEGLTKYAVSVRKRRLYRSAQRMTKLRRSLWPAALGVRFVAASKIELELVDLSFGVTSCV
jgi:hypothetical protein